jgi:aminocarboxymuconate-semialdehyde decarboxylase
MIGPKNIFLGTDYPYLIMQKDPAKFLADIPISVDTLAQIRNGAARRFLGLIMP